MRKLIALFVLLTVSTFAQYTYTTNYNITKIASGTLNWADALNNNWTKVDSVIKAKQDTLDAVKADFYTEHGYNGVHQDNKLTLGMLQTAEKAKLVQTTGTQTILGVKTFFDGLNASALFTLQSAASTNAGALWFTPTSYNELMFRSSTAQDTIPDKAWVRTNYVGTATAQTVTGAKTFSGITTLSGVTTASAAFKIGSTLCLTSAAATFDSVATPSALAVGGQRFIYLNSAGNCSIGILDGTTIDGQVLVIVNSGTPTILMLDATGNMQLAGNFLMGQWDSLTLIYNNTAGKFIEVARSNN